MFTIITRNNCVFCERAKETLQKESLPYQELNIEEERWLLSLIKRSGFTTVPQIYSQNGDHIGGFSELEGFLNQ
mgnify:CR=1 FL=1